MADKTETPTPAVEPTPPPPTAIQTQPTPPSNSPTTTPTPADPLPPPINTNTPAPTPAPPRAAVPTSSTTTTPKSQPNTAPATANTTPTTQPTTATPRQHPPITAPLVQQTAAAPRPQTPTTTTTPTVSSVPPASNGPFRPQAPSSAPPASSGAIASLPQIQQEGGSQDQPYSPYQPYSYPYYPPYEQYFPSTSTTTTTTTTTRTTTTTTAAGAPKKGRKSSAPGPHDLFGLGNPSATPAPPSRKSQQQQQPPQQPQQKNQQQQQPPPYPGPFAPLYQNAYTGPTGQYPPGPDLSISAPFNPLASSSFLPPPGSLPPPSIAGLPMPYLPSGPMPEGCAPPKRKRASPASPALGMPGSADGQPKRRRKSPEDVITDSDPYNFSKWTPSDDVLLKDCIQGAPSFEKIARTVRFSAKFSAEQIKNRWNALLYDPKIAGEAAMAMAQLPSINRRVLWSDHEEDILRTEVHSTHFVSFQKVLEKNRAIFHSSRTAKSLEAHYYRMKRHGTLQKMNFTNLTNSTFSQMEQSLYSSNDGAHFTDPDTLKDRQKQYRSLEKTTQRTALRMEKELTREKDKRQKLLAIFRGRYLRYEMKSKEILLGRMSSDVVVDVDLSEEGNAAKVSRQQAIIKLKRDCEFYIKNIGRRLIFINGKPLEKGKKARLVDATLIEIHNLQFIFEINKGLISKLKKAMQQS